MTGPEQVPEAANEAVPEAPDEAASEAADEAAVDRPWSFHGQRVLGLFLVVLIPIHFAITVIVDDIGRTDANAMTTRLRNTTWAGVAWLTVTFAVTHAVLSLRGSDNGSDKSSDTLKTRVLYGAGALVVAAATVLILFNP